MIRSAIFALAVCALMQSCEFTSIGSSKKIDSLFLGIYLGMPAKEFYDRCWELNRQKLVVHGPTNQNVEYFMTDAIDHPIYMRFYPYFYKDKIYQMPVTFTYQNWAPWARDYHANVLIEKLIPMLEKWYGPGFQSKVDPRKGRVYARIDGHRRMTVMVKDEQFVQMVITHIGMEKDFQKEVDELKARGE
jgi:hypothetical protein